MLILLVLLIVFSGFLICYKFSTEGSTEPSVTDSIEEKSVTDTFEYESTSTLTDNPGEQNSIEYEQSTIQYQINTMMVAEVPSTITSTTAYTANSPSVISASTITGEVIAASNVNSSRSFGAEKTIDGNIESCWCVNTANSGGAGAQIKFYLNERCSIGGIKIINGNLYIPEDELYSLNGQIKNFTLTFSDGTTKSFTASFNSNTSGEYQTFYFDSPVVTDSVVLTVDSGYTGTLYGTNVCLGEFRVF